ncbi:hypothetical protein [Nostoc sp. DedQUE04]|nr:hypothetical protein [Nostoc sp. DedQUE04]
MPIADLESIGDKAYWRVKTKIVHKYNSCGVGILPAPDGLEAHPTRK